MNYDEDDYIDETESLLEDNDFENEEFSDISDESNKEIDSEEFENFDTNRGNNFSYNQNSFNPYNFNQNDVNNIRGRITNNAIANNNNINRNTYVNNNSLEKKDELSDKNNLNDKETLENKNGNDVAHETIKKVAGKVAEGYGGKAVGALTEKAVDSKVGQAIVDNTIEKAKKGLKTKILLGGAMSFVGTIVIIGIIASVAIAILALPFAVLGIDLGDFGSNSSDSYVAISGAKYLWPIGSQQTTEKDDVTYATGNPASTKITSNYGKRKDPLTGATKTHNGVDIGGVTAGKTNVIAANSGIVVKVVTGCKSYGTKSCGGGYGNHIMISHNDGKYTLYAHLHQNTITVKKNDHVNAGQVIAKTGSSGRSTGAHLHFEVRTNYSNRTNPLNYIDKENPRPITNYNF